MVDKQGRNANRSGKWLENQVENTLNEYGIPSLYYKQVGTRFGQNIMKREVPGFLLKNVPYINMLGSESRGEFVLQIANKGSVRIECRKQDVAGSVDEKIPYLIGNCYSFEEKDVILILEGDGMRAAAKKFAINAAKAIAYKNVRVMTLNQFKTWAHREFKTTKQVCSEKKNQNMTGLLKRYLANETLYN